MVDTWNAAQLNEAANNGSIGGGGSSLPSVTASDNGDVLGVVEGAWAKMEAPGVTQTVLYNPEVPASVSTDDTEVELDSVVTGYDYILVYTGNHDERSVGITTPEDLESTEKALIQSAGNEYFVLSVDSTDHKTLSIRLSDGSGRVLYKVVGIKL